MIPSFKYPDTCALSQGKQAARFVNSEQVALHKLRQLEIAASLKINVPARRINENVKGTRAITAGTDLRRSRYFGLSDGHWLRTQVAHDTEVAKEKMRDVLTRIRPLEHA